MKGLVILLLTFSIVVMLGFLGWCIAAMYHAMNDNDDETNMFHKEDW